MNKEKRKICGKQGRIERFSYRNPTNSEEKASTANAKASNQGLTCCFHTSAMNPKLRYLLLSIIMFIPVKVPYLQSLWVFFLAQNSSFGFTHKYLPKLYIFGLPPFSLLFTTNPKRLAKHSIMTNDTKKRRELMRRRKHSLFKKAFEPGILSWC